MYTSKRWKQKLIDFVDSESDHFEQLSIDKASPREGELSLALATKKAGDKRVNRQQTFHNLTKTREGINCDAHRSVSTARGQGDKPGHWICQETDLL